MKKSNKKMKKVFKKAKNGTGTKKKGKHESKMMLAALGDW